MSKSSGFFLVLLLLASPALAADEKVSFDEQAALRYIRELSTDSMLGRKSGQEGGVLGENYIASRFEEWGLEVAGDDGSYFQYFTIPYWNLGQGAFLEIWAGNDHRDFYYREDWRAQTRTGSGHFSAEIVFAGYGIHAPGKGYDDYEGVDVKGKLVLFTMETPEKLTKKYEEEARAENRIKAAQEQGARGVLVFETIPGPRLPRLRIEPEMYQPDFVILSVATKVANFIIKELDTDFRSLYEEIEEQSKPMSFATGVKAMVAVDAEFDSDRTTRNVLAKITGSDENLKDEVVIVGGHMDHLGISHRGEIYNGANDNASGAAVAMEIARIMKLNGAKPKRTIIFAAWAGEEQGLLGSKYYCEQPSVEKTVMYINMDMVAHGNGIVPFSGKYYGPQIWEVLEEKIPAEILEYVEPGRGGPGGSDHSPFLAKGVPAFGIMTKGRHLKYHQVHDDINLVQPELLKKVGDVAHAAVTIMANEPGDFILPRRQQVYNFKFQNIVNYKLDRLEMVVEHKKDVKDADVDLQFSRITEKEELSGDELRLDMISSLLDAANKAAATEGLTLYSSSAGFTSDVREGKTTLLPGLIGINSFKDNLQWADALAKQGAFFVRIDDPPTLYAGDALSDRGKEIVRAIQDARLLLMVTPASAAQAKALLDFSEKPLILLEKDVPGGQILELIKEKDSGLGLMLTADTNPTAYFEKMEKVKAAIGTKHLMIVNEQCLWKEDGQNQMLDVIAAILEAEYEREDFANVFSAALLGIVDRLRSSPNE